MAKRIEYEELDSNEENEIQVSGQFGLKFSVNWRMRPFFELRIAFYTLVVVMFSGLAHLHAQKHLHPAICGESVTGLGEREVNIYNPGDDSLDISGYFVSRWRKPDRNEMQEIPTIPKLGSGESVRIPWTTSSSEGKKRRRTGWFLFDPKRTYLSRFRVPLLRG